MNILIFEPGKGCRKISLSMKKYKISIGKKIRDGYGNILLYSDFLPDYIGTIVYKDDKAYFVNYKDDVVFINGKEINDNKTPIRISHGSTINLEYGVNQRVTMVYLEKDIKDKWESFNVKNHNSILNASLDKKGYIIKDAEDIFFHGKYIESKYFIPRDGDVFLHNDYIFFVLKKSIFFTMFEDDKSNLKQNNKKTRKNNNQIAISMKNVSRYDKKKRWYRLKNINLEISAGRLVAIMGVSGAGKSTLFDSILGDLKLDNGEIKIAGNELGHVPQFSVLRKGNTVQEIMEYYASKKLKNLNKNDRADKIDELLNKLNLSLFKDSLVKSLSGGQSRRLDIAVQLLNEPKVILMDEPDSGLDVKSCKELYEVLSDIIDNKNSTILVITHNTHMACKYPYIDDLLFMASQGRICFYGDKNDALNYFNITDLDNIYDAVENNQDYFVDKYNKMINGGN